MLISYEYINGGLQLSYIDADGKFGGISSNSLLWTRPTNWEVTHSRDPERDPELRTWDGLPVKQVPCRIPNKYSILERLTELPEKIASKVFGFSTDVPLYFVDIETKKGKDGYSEPWVASEPITLITVCKDDRMIVLGTRAMSAQEQDYVNNKVANYAKDFGIQMRTEINSYATEREMLFAAFALFKSMPIITGWNFLGYDWPYLTNRYRKYGGKVADCSIVGRTEMKTVMNRGQREDLEVPMHKLILDYMEIYNKWGSPKLTNVSAKLDFVSEKTLGVKKVDYEKDLENLMNTDYQKFVFYGCVDTLLVQLIHRKMQYFNIMISISNLSKIRLIDTLSVIAVTEGMMRERFKKEQNIVFVRKTQYDESEDSLPGGWVMNPVIGKSMWVIVKDFNSLYPTTQMIFNIGPESLRGTLETVDGVRMVRTLHQGLKPLGDKDIVTADLNDGKGEQQYAVFDGTDECTTVKVLSDTYSNRKAHQRQMNDAKKQRAEISERIKYLSSLL